MSKTTPLWGTDESEHQAGHNLGTLPGQDYSWTCLRGTGGLNRQGGIWLDRQYDVFERAATAAELVQGAYMFLVEKPAKMQVDAFFKVVKSMRDKFLMLDFELYEPAPRFSPTNRTLRAVIAELRNRGYKKPIVVYSGKGYWDGFGMPSGPLAHYGDNLIAWDASYPFGMASGFGSVLYERCLPFGWGVRWGNTEPMFWQFTGYGRVSGYPNPVDLNAYRGTMDELVALTRDGTRPAPPLPGPAPPAPPPTPGPPADWWPVQAPPRDKILPPVPGNYTARHPTRYGWRSDVQNYVVRLFKTFYRISINTYDDHPATELEGPVFGGRDRTSLDIWARAGRGQPLDPVLGDAIVTYLMTDPNPPFIDWIIWQRRMWTRGTRQWRPFGTDPFSWHDDHIHVTFVGPQQG